MRARWVLGFRVRSLHLRMFPWTVTECRLNDRRREQMTSSSYILYERDAVHRASTGVTLLLDTVVRWRLLKLISARFCALMLWTLRTDAHITYDGTEAAPAAHSADCRARGCAFQPIKYQHDPFTHSELKALARCKWQNLRLAS